ncbi:MAG: hypothetical protein H0T12_01430 [Actinobacteria bacterium]|nr:hypothetical protein [Actinomycetota bacterium]
MTHGDERGLRLPPKVAPVQVVVVPIYRSDDQRTEVLVVAHKLRDSLAGEGIRVRVDDRDQYRPGYKFSEWELKGVPIRIEIGPKDVAADQVVTVDRLSGAKRQRPTAQAAASIPEALDEIQAGLHRGALAYREANTHAASSYAELRAGITEQSGLWVGPWCGDAACEERVTADTKATIRVLPLVREDPGAPCVVCGGAGLERATWARAY